MYFALQHKPHSLRKRLASTSGETIVETLAAIVICVLASVVLMTGVGVAVSINARSAEANEQFQLQERAAAEQTVALGSAGSVSVTVKPADDNPYKSEHAVGATYAANAYGGDDVYAYTLQPTAGDADGASVGAGGSGSDAGGGSGSDAGGTGNPDDGSGVGDSGGTGEGGGA